MGRIFSLSSIGAIIPKAERKRNYEQREQKTNQPNKRNALLPSVRGSISSLIPKASTTDGWRYLNFHVLPVGSGLQTATFSYD